MVTDLYAHTLDEDRKQNAQRFEINFYANPNMQQVEREVSKPVPAQTNGLDLQQLFSQLQQNPEVLGQLAALLKSVWLYGNGEEHTGKHGKLADD